MKTSVLHHNPYSYTNSLLELCHFENLDEFFTFLSSSHQVQPAAENAMFGAHSSLTASQTLTSD